MKRWTNLSKGQPSLRDAIHQVCMVEYPYKSHLSIASKSNEANTDRYLKKIKPRESFKNRLTASQQAKVNSRDNAGAAPETRFCSKYVLLNKDWRRIAMEIAFTDPQP